MAVNPFNFHHLARPHCDHSNSLFVSRSSLPLQFTVDMLRPHNLAMPSKTRHKRFCIPNSSAAYDFMTPNTAETGEIEYIDSKFELFDNCKRLTVLLRSFLPGGSWWKLSDSDEEGSSTKFAKPVTVLLALNRIWELVAEDRWVAYTAFAALAIAALLEISIPNLLTASVFSAQSGQTSVFYRNSQILLLLCLSSSLCSGMRSGCFGIANMVLLKHLRETLFRALIFQDISFFDKETVGDLTSRLGADCQRLSRIIGNDIHLILRNLLQGTGALVNLLTLSWPLALSTVVICLLLSTIFLFYGQFQKEAAKFSQEYNARANEVAQETFTLMRTVRAYGTEEEELRRQYKYRLEKLAYVNLRESVAYGFWNLSFSTLYRSTQVIAILLGGMCILTGHASAEQIMKYVLYCEWMIYAAWRVENNLSSLFQSIGASERVFQLLALMPSDQFLLEGTKLRKRVGKIEFVDVSFHYPSRLSVPVLENVNISVQANEMVAIVGLNGSGKSTLVNLLLHLYEPTNGQILIDGFPLKNLDLKWLRDKIGFVGQEPHLFHMNVRSNISYGCRRDITQKDIEEAAKQAHAHEFISSLPNGYETIVDDNLLSGGQKQRIAIARAIIRDPTILILDEATSALDAENEYNITRVLHAFRNDTRTKRTVIVIAHRLSTVRAADKIIVMDRGQVNEAGKHLELLQRDGLYARLIRTKTDAIS